MEKKIKVLFFGSSVFSIEFLQAIINDQNLDLVGLVTKPPKPFGRGMSQQLNIVHDTLLKLLPNTPVFCPQSLNNNEIYEQLKSLNVDICVLVAYGQIIPTKIINLPKIEFINIHPSSLPNWRGAAPIERTIESGDLDLDICAIKLVKELDAGDIIDKINYKFTSTDHASDILPNIANIGSRLLINTIKNVCNNNATYSKQIITSEISYAKKIDKNELLLDFNSDVMLNFNKIKAFNLSGCCYFFDHKNRRIKVIKAQKTTTETSNNLGFSYENGQLYFQNGSIILDTIQPESSRAMSIREFLNGVKL